MTESELREGVLLMGDDPWKMVWACFWNPRDRGFRSFGIGIELLETRGDGVLISNTAGCFGLLGQSRVDEVDAWIRFLFRSNIESLEANARQLVLPKSDCP